MKHLILLFAMILFPVGGCAQTAIVGTELTWSLSGDTLTISGTGAMPDWNIAGAPLERKILVPPWFDDRDKISYVIIGNGVTGIGVRAFAGCVNLVSVSIPGSVTRIGDEAFYECVRLTSISIPGSVTRIGGSAFYGCSSLTSVTVPHSVTSIGGSAFAGCPSLTSIEVEAGNPSYFSADGVLFHSDKVVLLRCPGGKTGDYDIPHGVTRIEEGAFASCDSLTSISLPGSVTHIGRGAFYDCSSLTSMSVPRSVTRIGTIAFYGCNSLTSVSLPRSVTDIEEAAFTSCPSLASIEVETGNPSFSSADGVLFNGDSTVLVCCPGGKTGHYDIPCSVITIGAYAFSDCNSLTSVSIPSSVTRIGYWAFGECGNLTSVSIPNSVTSIGEGAFYECGNLTSVTVPHSVTSIGDRAFHDCSHLKHLTVEWPEPLSLPDDDVFEYVLLESVTLHVPVGAKPLYKAAEVWERFGTITEQPAGSAQIEIEGTELTWSFAGGTLTVSGNGAMPDWSTYDLPPWSAYHDEITSATVGNGVTRIGAEAFGSCSNLVSVSIPHGVKDMGRDAFAWCGSLASISIPGSVTRMGDGAFYGCCSLTSVTIPHGVTRIEKWTFSGCCSLTSVTIPGSVTRIEDAAFAGCNSLTSITIPGSVTSIGDRAFHDCSHLKHLTVEWAEPLSIPDDVFEEVPLKSVTLHVPAGTKPLYEAAGCWKQFGTIAEPSDGYAQTAIEGTELTWSLSNRTLIVSGNGAMPDWNTRAVSDPPWFNDRDKISFVIIKNGVTTIGARAFSGCSSLTSVTIPHSVTSIGECTFFGCSSLEHLTVEWPEPLSIPDDVFEEVPLKSATLHVPAGTKPLYEADEYWKQFGTIAEQSTGYAQTAIEGTNLTWSLSDGTLTVSGNGAMPDWNTYEFPPWSDYYDEISSVMIGNGVTRIGDGTFDRCRSLTSVFIPGCVTSIGTGAFFDCPSLTSIEVETGNPSFSSADGVLFNSDKTVLLCCPGGKTGNYDIPHGVAHIGEIAFAGCSGLTSISIPHGVADIGEMAFGGCSGLTSVYIPSSVTDIGDGAFAGCSSLTSVTVPQGVTRIGKVFFYECSSLASVTIPHSVTDIGEGAFYGCRSLTSVTVPHSVTRIEAYAFYNCSHLEHLTVEWPEPLSIPDDIFEEVPLKSVTLHVPAGTKPLYEAAGCWKQFGTIAEPSDGCAQTAIEGTELTWSLSNRTLTVSGNGAMPDWSNHHFPPWDDSRNEIDSVTVGNGVTRIGAQAFGSCSNLVSVSIPHGVTDIGREAFAWCGSLASISIPGSVTRMGEGAFYGCGSLTSVTVPHGVTHIEKGTFSSCGSLTSVSIPGSVTGIGEAAFYGCGDLTSVTVPDSVTHIDDRAFAGCSSLTSAAIPHSVTHIGERAFAECLSLTSVSIPRNVSDIGAGAFSECYSLKHLTVEWPEPLSIPDDVFEEVPLKSVTLHVSTGTKPLYEAAGSWKQFGTIAEP